MHVSLQIIVDALLIWTYQTLVTQCGGEDKGWSTHSTGSLEGVTFLAVVIVDKSSITLLDLNIFTQDNPFERNVRY